jgi:hypothetical protein
MRSVERAVRSVPFRVGYPPTEAWPGDTDFAAARIVGRATEDLASSLGNLANRTLR